VLAGIDAALTVDVIGDNRTAVILPEPAYDPKGTLLRS
jgi:hypothetical protein